MIRKLVWVMASAVVGVILLDLTRSLRQRRRHTEVADDLTRWEDEGGNVVGPYAGANS